MAGIMITGVPQAGGAGIGASGVVAPAGGAAQLSVIRLDPPQDAAFSLAFQQALAAVVAGGIRQFFEMPEAAAVDGQTASPLNEVALENLAAGEIPPGLLQAISAVQHADVFADGAPNGPSDRAKEAGATVKSLLAYLAGIVAPLLADAAQAPAPQAQSAQAPEGQGDGTAVSTQGAAEALPQVAASPVADAQLVDVLADSGTEEAEEVPMPVAQQATKEDAPAAGEVAPEAAMPIASTPDAAEPAPLASARIQTTEAAEPVLEASVQEVRAAGRVPAEAPHEGAPTAAVIPAASDEALSALPGEVEVTVEPAPVEQPTAKRTREARQRQVAVADTARTDSVRTDAVQDARQVPVNAGAANSAVAVDVPPAAPVQAVVSSDADKDALEAIESAPPERRERAAEGQAVRQNTAPRADQDRVISRIAAAITQNQASGRTTVRIRLYPPEMGTVRVEVSSVRGAVSARIEASSQAAHEALQSNIGALRAELREAGIELRDMQVRYRESASQFSLQDQQSRRGAQEQPRHSGRSRSLEHAVEVEQAASFPEAPLSGRVNILV